MCIYTIASTGVCIRPAFASPSPGAVAPWQCKCNSIALAMTIYRVHYVDRICDGEDEYNWTRKDFTTCREALRYARSCEGYEQAEVERLEPDDLEYPF